MRWTQYTRNPNVWYNTERIRACPCNKSAVALAGVPKHRSRRACPRNRSVVAPTGVSKHRSGRPLIHSSVLGSHTIICLSEFITYLNHILCSYHLCRFTRSLSIHSLLHWLSLVHSCISYHLLSFLVICDNNHI